MLRDSKSSKLNREKPQVTEIKSLSIKEEEDPEEKASHMEQKLKVNKCFNNKQPKVSKNQLALKMLKNKSLKEKPEEEFKDKDNNDLLKQSLLLFLYFDFINH